MKLIFVYVKKFKMFSHKEFNLDSGYVIHFKSRTRILTIQKRPGINPGFWQIGESPDKTTTVESVSAIIGENGSGKTTFARLIHELFRDFGKPEFEGVAVFQADDMLTALRTSGPELVIDSSLHVSQGLMPLSIGLSKAKYCYYSPVYTTERDRGREIWNDGDTCYDLSTTGMLQSCVREMSIRDGDAFTAFDIDEKRRVLEFLSSIEEIRQQRSERSFVFPIRYPVAVWLEIEELAVQHAREALMRKKEMLHGSEEANSEVVALAEQRNLTMLDRILVLAGGVTSSDFFVRAFIWFGILHLYDLNLTQFSTLGGVTDVALLDFLESISSSKESPRKIQAQIFAFLEDCPPMCTRNGRVVDDKAGKAVLRTFRCLHELLGTPGVKEESGLIVLPLEMPEVRRKLLALVKLHSESSIISKFFRFSFPHSISSGEMAFYTMFGRLFERFTQFESEGSLRGDVTEALVFFDEAETTLHPNFQRGLVFNLIWFFETLFPRVKVHLVFATHSPILLSDIPKHNCKFLFRSHERGSRNAISERTNTTIELLRLKNTFGANIFDLYRLSFFMKDGTIGLFAERKIRVLISEINERLSHSLSVDCKVKSDDDRSLYKEQLLEIHSLIGDPFLSSYVKRGFQTVFNQ